MRPAIKIASGAVALAAALGVGGWWLVGAPESQLPQRLPPSAAAHVAAAAPAQSGTDSANGFDADPLVDTSLRGTAADGDVGFDAAGTLLLDAALRRYFDYHLSLIGERDLAQIRALLRRSLAARFDAARIERVLAHFDRYTAYQRALSDAAIAAQSDPAQRLASVKRLRREMLGEAMAAAFFAEEEALAALSLRRMRIARDPATSAEQKREALAALDREAGYAARETAMLADLAAEQDAQFERMRLPSALRRAEREATWGTDAAQRLAALDAERADWDARLHRYIAERARIDANPRLDATGRAREIDALRTRSFNATERHRIAALEAVGQLQAALGSR